MKLQFLYYLKKKQTLIAKVYYKMNNYVSDKNVCPLCN